MLSQCVERLGHTDQSRGRWGWVSYNNGNKQTTIRLTPSVWCDMRNSMLPPPPPSPVQVRPLSGTRRVKDEHEVIFSLFLPALPGQDMTQFLFPVTAWSVSHIINTNIPHRTIFHQLSFLPSSRALWRGRQSLTSRNSDLTSHIILSQSQAGAVRC